MILGRGMPDRQANQILCVRAPDEKKIPVVWIFQTGDDYQSLTAALE